MILYDKNKNLVQKRLRALKMGFCLCGSNFAASGNHAVIMEEL